jgi:hypothetical protein
LDHKAVHPETQVQALAAPADLADMAAHLELPGKAQCNNSVEDLAVA